MDNFWQQISTNYQSKINEIGINVSKSKNEMLFIEGQPYSGFYIVEKGSFKVFKGNLSGEEATLSLVYPGQIISAMPIITMEQKFHADCVSLGGSRAMFIPAKPFRRLLLEHPELQMEFSKILISYLMDIRNKYLSLMLENSEQRLLNFLNKIPTRGGTFVLPVQKKHIAALLDITPESLSRLIAKLASENKISIQGKYFRLLR